MASAQRQLRYLQWAIPALTGTLVILDAVMANKRRVLVGPDARAFDLLSRLPASVVQRVLVAGAGPLEDRCRVEAARLGPRDVADRPDQVRVPRAGQADRVVVVEAGRVTWVGAPDEAPLERLLDEGDEPAPTTPDLLRSVS